MEKREEVIQSDIGSAPLRRDHPTDAWRFKISVNQEHALALARRAGPPFREFEGERDAVEGAADSAFEGMEGTEPHIMREHLGDGSWETGSELPAYAPLAPRRPSFDLDWPPPGARA